MALEDRQRKAIELLAEGTMKISEIAKVCDVSRQTVYNWRQDSEFKAELDRYLSCIKTEASDKINSSLIPIVNELLKIALSDDTPIREKKECLQYLCNRALGSPVSAVNMAIEDNRSNENIDAFAEFKAFLAEQEVDTEEEKAE